MGDEPSNRIESVAAILRTLSEGKSPIIAVHGAKPARTRLLDDLVPALGRRNYRVIQVMSLDGVRIDLNSLMDQVIGHGCVDVIERSERCHAALTAPGAEQVVLIVDDAHLLADQALHYLDLVTSIGRLSLTPPHIVLFGSPDLLACLPRAGNLAPDKAALRIAIPDEFVEPDPDRSDSLPFDMPGNEGAADTTGTDPVSPEVSPELSVEEGPASVEPPESCELAAIAEPAAIDAVTANEMPAPIDGVVAGEEAFVVHDSAAREDAGARHDFSADEGLTDDVRGEIQASDVVEPAEPTPAVQIAASEVFDTLPDTTDVGPQVGVAVSTRSERREQAEIPPAPARRRWGVLAASVGLIVVGGGLAADRLGLIQPRHFGRARGVEVAQARGVDPLVTAESATVGVPKTLPQEGGAGAGTSAGDASHTEGETAPQAAPSSDTDRPNAVAPADTPDHPVTEPAPVPAVTTATQVDANRPEPTPPLPSPAAVEPPTDAKAVVSPPQPPRSAAVEPPTDAKTVASPPQPAPSATVPNPPSDAGVGMTAQPASPTDAKTVASPTQPPQSATVPNPPSDAGAGAAATAQPALPAASAVGVAKPETVVPANAGTSGTPPAPNSLAARPAVSSSVVTLLITRGDALLATGDVSAARLMYQRAAGSNSAQGALAMGRTYDPKFLAGIGARGIAADPKQAHVWYRRAADMGSPEATRMLTEPQGK